jgi:hypothetical protein
MSPEDYKYDVFISYRHLAQERKVAIWLLRAMETFRTPKRLVKEQGCPPRIKRAFRDDEELSAGNLSEAITKALGGSKFLVVICSTDTAASKWVNDEIEIFRSLGNSERILPVLISGDPESSFPAALKRIKRSSTTDDSESLAVDLRPGRGLSRRLALLKLMAPVLGCSFDDLRQRAHERQIRQRNVALATLVLILGLMTALAGVAWWQYRQALLANAKNQQRLATEYIRSGDILSAVELLSDLVSRGVDRDGSARTQLTFVASGLSSLNQILKGENRDLNCPSVVYWNRKSYFVTKSLGIIQLEGMETYQRAESWSLSQTGNELLVFTGGHFLGFLIPAGKRVFDVDVTELDAEGKRSMELDSIDAQPDNSWTASGRLVAQQTSDKDTNHDNPADTPLNLRIDDRGHQSLSATSATQRARESRDLVFPTARPEDSMWTVAFSDQEISHEEDDATKVNRAWKEADQSVIDHTSRWSSGEREFEFNEVHGTGGSTYRVREMTSDGKVESERTFGSTDTDATPTLDGNYMFMHNVRDADDTESSDEQQQLASSVPASSVLFSLAHFGEVEGIGQGDTALFSPSYDLLVTYDTGIGPELVDSDPHLYTRINDLLFSEIPLPREFVRDPGLQAGFVNDNDLLLLNGTRLLLFNCKGDKLRWWMRVDLQSTKDDSLRFAHSDRVIAVFTNEAVQLIDLASGVILTGVINIHDALRDGLLASLEIPADEVQAALAKFQVSSFPATPLEISGVRLDGRGSLIVFLRTKITSRRGGAPQQWFCMTRRPPLDEYAMQRFIVHPERFTGRVIGALDPTQTLDSIQTSADRNIQRAIMQEISAISGEVGICLTHQTTIPSMRGWKTILGT